MSTSLALTVDVRHIEGMVRVSTNRIPGLGTAWDPDGNLLCDQICRKAGMQARPREFHGAPPAVPPGILHLLEIGKLGRDEVVPPPQEALAVNLARELSGIQEAAGVAIVDAVNVAEPVDSDDSMAGLSVGNSEQSVSVVATSITEDAVELYLESRPGKSRGLASLRRANRRICPGDPGGMAGCRGRGPGG